MNKLEIIQHRLNMLEVTLEKYPDSKEYEMNRFIEGIRLLLAQPDELTEDVIKPTASEVKQIVNDALRLHMRNYHGGHEGGGRF